MTFLKGLLQAFFLLALMNLFFLKTWTGIGYGALIPLTLVLVIFYIVCLFFPERKRRDLSHRLSVMKGGHRLIVLAAVCFCAELLLFAAAAIAGGFPEDWRITAANGLLAASLISFLFFVGLLRIVVTSTQLGIVLRLLLLFTWWIPLWNIFLFARACALVKREYYFEAAKAEQNETRREGEICATRYPILLVHGIFFRDWQFLNYWGRIPRELIRNGATVYYGRQQSAAPIAESASELAGRIREIIETEGCEKVNIIAHSKGGLDSRYALSRLGMDEYVASLTTINTPHRGCIFVERLLALFPDGLVHFIAGKYNAVFRRLGDSRPDFLGGVLDLTAGRCKVFNETTPDSPAVLYQSVASRMKGMFSFGVPLLFTYPIVKFVEGENDGLVTPASARWGSFLGLVTGSGYRGISHGDMVDLMRENIPGFDVTEFYVDLVRRLKERGC